MSDETTNRQNTAETVDSDSISRGSNPISRATLIMIGAAVVFLIIAGIIITMFFRSPTGAG